MFIFPKVLLELYDSLPSPRPVGVSVAIGMVELQSVLRTSHMATMKALVKPYTKQ
jgi:hypothetical protein